MKYLESYDIERVNGGNDTLAWSITGGTISAGLGSGAGTLAAVANGALTGASWGRWGGLIGLAVGTIAGASYGYLTS